MFISFVDSRNDQQVIINATEIVSVTWLSTGARVTLRGGSSLDVKETPKEIEKLLVKTEAKAEAEDEGQAAKK